MLYIVCKAERDCAARENAWQVAVPGKLAHSFWKCFKSIKKNSVLGHGNTSEWITKKKSPAQPLQWLGSPGPFWKAICPFGLSWAFASPCSQSGKVSKMKTWAEHMSTHCQHSAKLRWDPLVSSDIGRAAPNPHVKHYSRKCGTVSCAVCRLRKIKASLLKETLSEATPGLCPKSRHPSPLGEIWAMDIHRHLW